MLVVYSAAATRLYPLFLLALFVVAGGITVLQVAANPHISVLGPEESTPDSTCPKLSIPSARPLPLWWRQASFWGTKS